MLFFPADKRNLFTIFAAQGGGTEFFMRRVAVTGLGVISPVGNNVTDFWKSLVSGKNGIDKITYFDTEDYYELE